MKRKLCLALGALLMSLLPIGVTQGQNKMIQLTVKTLNHRTIESARIYAATPGMNYYVDSAHFVVSYTGEAQPLSVLTQSVDLECGVDADGNPTVSQSNVDSATYGYGFIVVRDVDGNYYVSGSLTDRTYGVFSGIQLFYAVTNDTLVGTLSSRLNLLLENETVIEDALNNYQFTAISHAIADVHAQQLMFADTVRLDSAQTIGRSVTVDQMGYPLISTATTVDHLFTINGNSTVGWMNGKIISAAGRHFDVEDNATLSLQNMTDTAVTSAMAVSDNGLLMLQNCTVVTTGSDAAVTLADSCHAAMNVVNISGNGAGVWLAPGSGSSMNIDETSAISRISGCTIPVDADSYTHDSVFSNQRVYFRSLKATAEAAAVGDTVVVVTDLTASPIANDFIEKPIVLDLGGKSCSRNIYVSHTADTVTVQNGSISSTLASTGTSEATLVMNFDMNGTLALDAQRNAIIVGGRYNPATAMTGNVTIEGGKFADTTGYKAMLAPRHTFAANDESDAAQYPFKVAEGYAVTYINFDYYNNDTTIVYNTPDNKINPMLNEPRYSFPGPTFVAYVTEADNLLTAWQPDVDVLTSDTTLYSVWIDLSVTTSYSYKVRYIMVELDSTLTVDDSMTSVAPSGSALRLRARYYAGRVPDADTKNISSLVSDTVVDFYYTLVKYALSWSAAGGRFSDSTNLKVDSLYYGDTIVFPEDPKQRGYSFAGWVPNDVTTMPDNDLVMIATYERDTFGLTWTGADTTVVYTATAVDGVSAVLIDTLSNDTIPAVLTYRDANDVVVDSICQVGTYTVTARLTRNADDYQLEDSVTTVTVTPAQLTFGGFNVTMEKLYDGNANAAVTGDTAAMIQGVLGDDDVNISSITATYDSPEEGTGKNITVNITVAGNDAVNYTPLTFDSVIAGGSIVRFGLTWTGADTTVVYTATAVDGVSAVLIDTLSNDTIPAVLTYRDANDVVVDSICQVGTYTVTARLTRNADDYQLEDSVTTVTVTPAQLTFGGFNVTMVKLYDGNANAAVTGDTAAMIQGVLGNDDVYIGSIVATYDTPDYGTGKNITVHITVAGNDNNNYTPLTFDSIITGGIIIQAVQLDSTFEQHGVSVEASGYCAGNGAISYTLIGGSATPDEYMLDYSDDAFADVAWTTIANPGTIDIVVPDGIVEGIYSVKLVLRNSAAPNFPSDTIQINFRVNLPRTYTMPLFDDVIALVDTCHCFTNIQWYRDGVAIPGANGLYYQEVGGLAGHTYHVTATMNGQATSTCEQTDVTTQIADEQAPVSVKVYPNPTTNNVNISIMNSMATMHTVRVMNVMGVTVENSTFEGENTTASHMAGGSYTVSVDGVVVRVIKK